MSVSELSDLGVAHPWANLRVNDITVDNVLTANDVSIFNLDSTRITSQAFAIPQSQVYDLFLKIGGVARTTTPSNLTVYTLPLINGTCIYLKFYLCAKGGPVGSTNNFLVQEQSGFVTVDLAGTANIQAFPITGTNIIQGAGFPTAGQVGGTLTFVGPGNNLAFQVHNSVGAGQTTDFTWCLDIYKLQTTL